ncbi:acetyl-CoA carboxylase biotin carboxyl carrier protein [Membranihabitans maritimus]|uniref:acetyl-CoA carboxylase biotin carboxyl carrier protein n=1 Tax=Membranihabitans maritimus TaxID=2904244 RepID=UPI001F000D41|nr:acetyl-CoA carboxylase biotin carboxyl carrier protein [Membranihabitans maritimus]
MNYKEITELLKLISDSHLSEFKMKDGDFELSVKTDKYQKKSKDKNQIIQIPGTQALQPGAAEVAQPVSPSGGQVEANPKEKEDVQEKEEDKYLEIKSPMVGTFYRSSAPDKPPFVKVGDQIEKGSVVCIVEAMKLFNEIESEISGKVVKVVVEDAAPVEYDQVLFLVDPS